jgi:hypothetical protein
VQPVKRIALRMTQRAVYVTQFLGLTEYISFYLGCGSTMSSGPSESRPSFSLIPLDNSIDAAGTPFWKWNPLSDMSTERVVPSQHVSYTLILAGLKRDSRRR